jgi:mannitol/fructose-specific phosphotransferase system IIA component (Ntr-type)
MTPASEVAFLESGKPWSANLSVIRSRKFSRYPLCGSSLDDARGIVHLKDVSLLEDRAAPDLDGLARPAVVFPADAPLERVLRELMQRRSHMALVAEGSGKVSGIITLEDVIEELVGEIRDEFEAPSPALLVDVAVPGAIDVNLPRTDKAQILRRLLSGVTRSRPDISFDEAWGIVWRREQAFNSALGGGIAIFHGRLSRLEKPALGIGRCAEGLDFQSADKAPVKLVFLLLTCIKEPGVHLKLLSRVAALSSEETFRRNLMKARNPGEVLDILQAFGLKT